RAKISTWLYRVTMNLCLDVKRRRRQVDLDAVPELADPSSSVADQMQERSRQDALQDALMQLPDRQRQAVVLRHIEDLSNPEIAGIMEISVEAVESLTARGKRALSAALSGRRAELGYQDG
ncbi:MAG: sigma-70 family RNA polymerase sigma factor, partial [Pseudomonadota bacterium]